MASNNSRDGGRPSTPFSSSYLSTRPNTTRPHAAASTLSPQVASASLRQSRYSPTADDFMVDTSNIVGRSFQSPARGAASFIPRAYNSASRYSVLGNLNRRNRSVSQHEVEYVA